ncbi:hypothetical protein CDD81_1678 [Ophiocordyceps australis]|uniref:Mitochondrial thiamine pyrophosphate carrier 1 n=1 Tax=Ophiocordyceps australis TaxID=1399860 RepID=A0A2C5Y0D4_9HYPO|nr:hypothetical protein CDD81_1678 [Ophiocordyceps australis]
MRDTSHAGLSPATVEAVAGLSAGSAATLALHPLDIVKTRMQISRSRKPARPKTVPILRSMTSSPRPLESMYRGLMASLVGNATSWSCFFFFKSKLEQAAVRMGQRSQPTATDYFIASGLAGLATSVLTNPIWVLKTRMLSSDRSAAGAYPSMLAGARTILATEGWRGFYRGLGVSMLGMSHTAVLFVVYEPAKQAVLARSIHSDDHLSVAATVGLSSLSKLAAVAATYPYQVVRTRLQNYYRADRHCGKGICGVVVKMWTEEGLLGFYRGLVPSVIRVMPATWITFVVYENVKYYLSPSYD